MSQYAHNRIDILGNRYGKLTVVDYVRKDGKGKWVCKCDCGEIVERFSETLRNGITKDCGCTRRKQLSEQMTIHGKTKHPLYRIWCHMRSRCGNVNDHKYPSYGGRGIKVCDEWANNFMAFYEWSISNGYSENLSIDRINNDGDYCPDNCRWTTSIVQSNNRRNNTVIEFNNKKMTIAEWGRELGINPKNISQRINRGWDIERALSVSDKRKQA